MPTSARKSSVGSGVRRGPQKAHIPYRGDNPEVGKKTGIAVQHVERKSDGFEPFEQIMQQADDRTPPKPKGRKKSRAAPQQQEDSDDENGEMSMELDDSPLRYLSNVRPPSTPSNLSRVRSSSRAVARTSDVDFDQIPSPRPRSSKQKAVTNGGPGPSSLSKSIHARELEPESDPPEHSGDYDQSGMDIDNEDFDDYGPQESEQSPDKSSPRRTSFTQIDEEDEDEEDQGDMQDVLPQLTPRDKGKRKASAREEESPQDVDVEDDIARGLNDVGEGMDSDEEEEAEEQPEREPERKSKKMKVAEDPDEEKTPRARPMSKAKKENRPIREGTRRSERAPMKPLEWWRGEKVVYGKPTSSSGPVLVAPIREIRRIPKEVIMPLAAKRKRGSTRARSKSIKLNEDDLAHSPVVLNPEAGWDDDTEPTCTVLSYGTKEEVRRRIAWTAKMVNPKIAANSDWSFDKIFGDDEFIAAGQLIIPPNARKPSKATKDNTYIFYVMEGAINLKVHDTSLVLATGGMFMVPRGNTYFIENICNRDAKLFFTQARKVIVTSEERARSGGASNGTTPQKRKSGGRSSSAGATLVPAIQVNGHGVAGSVPPPAAKRSQSTKV